ncbi:MAG: hypothetical protein HY323_05380 [Betaproteobacteria bacterium]|nr:hypothetical protein [Betaproteobacteria bacterium]
MTTTKAQQVAAPLREIADWLDAAPDFEGSISASINLYTHDAAGFYALVRALGGKRKKDGVGNTFWVERRFGQAGVITVFAHDREQVCRKVVTGTREISEEVIPAHTEEIIEWECPDALLSSLPEDGRGA